MKHTPTLIATALVALSLPLSAQAAGEAKNVIFFVGDGMGPTTVTAARIYKYGEAGQLNMEKLSRTARIKTFSNDAQTTDSAPSMAAYMTGVKMNNEVISMTADTKAITPTTALTGNCGANNGKAVETILELAKGKGKAVGAITTTRITHATPAATYSHVCHRDAENDIAVQAVPGGAGYNPALKDGLDVLLGGGKQFFVPKADGGARPDGRHLVNEMKAAGYTYVETGSALTAVDGKAVNKLFGLFNKNHMDYELDRVKKSLDQPSLADMTIKAIDVLSKNPNGYFLMVEGGRIDHALHGTNAKRVLEDTIAFDDAIKAALAKVDLSNTLLVFTADHDHTMTINGYSRRGNPILDISRSYREADCTDPKNPKTCKANTDADGNTYTTLVFGNGPNRKDIRTTLTSGDTDKSMVLHDDYMQETGIRLGSETHGGGDVMLGAGGAGAKGFKGTLDNTKVFGLLKAAMGL
ncbi:alkaline phosphatase [Chitinivorax tropicus]|uniref:Alkaline phosphatase n=1 Tax=Chitinivorax tropicus TaxID=714531 RepID=A0A840MIT3_9PROT|nr:alkaline phosphatase [Chitinivorax tropicus]MBB5019114.1 alkaline phosphatase [Chitinivorax tropicus]